MRSIEMIMSQSSKKEDSGDPVVMKSSEDIPAEIEPKKLREVYVRDNVTYNAINKTVQLILASEHKLAPNTLNTFLEDLGDIGTPTTWKEILENIFRHTFIYGSAWVELIHDKYTDEIIDLVNVNPETMDYARDSRGNVVVDRYSRPVGYTHKLPIGVAAPEQKNIPNRVKLDSHMIFVSPDKMAKIDLFMAGDGLKSYGLIEPGYASIRTRIELESAYATALDKAFPVRIGKYGDQMNRPTPQKLEGFLSKLVNLRGKNDTIAIPYHSSIEMLESKGVQSLSDPLNYFLTLGLAGFGIPIPFAVGLGEATNRSTLSTQADVYAKTLQQMVFRITDQIERKIFIPVLNSKNMNVKNVPKFTWDKITFEQQKGNKTANLSNEFKPIPNNKIYILEDEHGNKTRVEEKNKVFNLEDKDGKKTKIEVEEQ